MKGRKRETVAAVLIVGVGGLLELARYAGLREVWRELDKLRVHHGALIAELEDRLNVETVVDAEVYCGAPDARGPGPARMTAAEQLDRLRTRMAAVAEWADRYDGGIAGTILDALNLDTPHWTDDHGPGAGVRGRCGV